MEARRGAADKRSYDLGIGVKSQSSPVIAGSYRNRPKSSLDGDGDSCRATDLRFWGRNPSVSCSTPKITTS